MSQWIDEEAAAEVAAEALTISVVGPFVIKFTNAGAEFFWSDAENQCVAPSGDVVFFPGQAAAVRRLEELKVRFPAAVAAFEIVHADEIDKRRGIVAPRAAPTSPLPYTPTAPRPTPPAFPGAPAAGAELSIPEYDEDGDPDPMSGAWEVDGDGDVRFDGNGDPIRSKAAAPVVSASGRGYTTNAEFALANKDRDIPVSFSNTASQTLMASGGALTDKFGPPTIGDEWKIGMSWRIMIDGGSSVAIHDYCGTDLYDDALPSPSNLTSDAAVRTWCVSPETATAAVQALLS